jgi:hypothetical protein
MERRCLACVAAAVVAAAVAAADTVYLADGRKLEGDVQRAGRKVRVTTADGTVEVDADDVLYIVTPRPATKPAKPPALPQAPKAGPPEPAATRFTIDKASRPEPVIFLLMRSLSVTPAGSDVYALRKQIERWQIAAKDRKRRAGRPWLSPDDFVRRRQAFEAYLREARDLFRKAGQRTGYSASPPDRRSENLTAAHQKLRQAARAWADPLLRDFLSGAAELHAGNHKEAAALFGKCVSRAPRVAAFHQGLALARLEGGDALEALEAALEMLALRPGSRSALQLTRQAYEKVPGSALRSPTYLRARKVLNEYEDSSASGTWGGSSWSGTINWELPGRPVYGRKESLPTPRQDRLESLQAVGVPVGRDVLMVDARLVRDALEVFVRVDEDTVAPARVSRAGTYWSSRAASAPDLAFVHVTGWAFAPLKTADATFRKDEAVTAYALSMYEEMADCPRPIAGAIEEVSREAGDGESGKAKQPRRIPTKVSTRILAGEGASPVVTAEGALVGFLAGRTDAMADGGGPHAFHSLADLAPLLKHIPRGYAAYSMYGARRRKAEPVSVKGDHFIVYATFGERFE